MKTLKEIVEKEFKKLSAPKDWLITIENAKEKSYDIAQATRKDTLKDVLKSLDRINNNPYETSYLDVLEYFRKWLEKEVQKK